MCKGLLGLLAIALLIAGVPFAAGELQKAKPKKIVMMGMNTDHKAGEHEYMAGLAILEECLKQTPGLEVTVFKVSPNPKKEKGKAWAAGWPAEAKAMEDADCVVCFCKTAGDYFMSDGERKEKFQEIMKKGAGFVSLHWAVETKKEFGDPTFMAIQGGYYEPGYSTNPHNTATVKQADPQHPVSRGVKPFEARDEFYFKLRFMPEAKPVITATLKDYPKFKTDEYPDAPIGWVYVRKDNKGPHGEGRSFGFTGCHFHKNFAIEDFRRMIVNGILWAAGMEVPPNGAPVMLKAPVPDVPDKKGIN